ncbi:MAG: GTP-sensing pleiotropic transcriptional regulator CodY [Lachnospiraceae bacterium]|nr:GTP-sensing pleiotropic transcriptional regulator CodY [Lachnospiraceae bacterium]
MSSIELLDRTRRIRALLHDSEESKISFDDICRLMGSIVHSSVCLLSVKGKILGKDDHAIYPGMFSAGKGAFIDESVNDRLLRVLSTRENVRLDTLGIDDTGVMETEILIAPVETGRQRTGTLLFFRRNRNFSVDDIILCEYASTVISLELKRSLGEEEASEERLRSDIDDALSALSMTERQALVYVFERLYGTDLIVASKISKETGITRSVIVNALKKLESAGILNIRSGGVKGTHVEVLNPEIYDRIENMTV